MHKQKSSRMEPTGGDQPRLAPVIPFRAKAQTVTSKKVSPAPNVETITQERLRRGMQLLEEEWAAIRATRQFLLDLENDLMTGAEVEHGELCFDEALKMVRRANSSSSPAARSRR